jgi:pyruvate ferredoxin oxidoreductase gamma subunit
MAGLSVALGAATCKLIGRTAIATEHGVRQELAPLGLDQASIEQNVRLASIAYDRVTEVLPQKAVELSAPKQDSPSLPRVVTPTYQGARRGAPSVLTPATPPLRKTGNWRLWRPVIDLSRCSKCLICFVSCPEGAIALDETDNPRIDYDVCKGCLICVEECPTGTIHKLREVDA